MSSKPDLPPGGPHAWFIWSFAAISFGYAFFHRVAPSVMVSELMSDFAIGGAILGTLSALYFYPYVLLQVPIGAFLDRYGPRILMFSALTIAGAGSLIFGTATTLELAYLGRILIGIGCAAGFLSSLALAAKWFPPHQFALFAGLTMFSGMISGVMGSAPLAAFVNAYGWRASQWGLGLFSIVLAAAILLFVRNAPGDNRIISGGGSKSWGTILKDLLQAFKMPEVWKLAIVAAAMSGPMLALGGLWGTPYMMQAFDLPRTEAAFLVSLLLMGWAFGSPACGWLSGRLNSKKTLINLGCLLLVLAMGLVIFVPNLPLIATVIVFVVMGVAGSAMSVLFAMIRDVTPPDINSSANGIVNSLTVASGAVLQPLVGLALDMLWNGSSVDGVRVYQASDFRWSFSLILITVTIGLLISLTLKTKISEGDR